MNTLAYSFSAELKMIVGNPYVFVPSAILAKLQDQANLHKGPLPVKGIVNGKPYQQHLVKYSGAWRLYINMKMLSDSPRRIGEIISLTIMYDPSDRTIKPHDKLVAALKSNEKAKAVFDGLSPSRRKEIVRYIANLKTAQSVDKNVKRAIRFLLGKERFIGRDRP